MIDDNMPLRCIETDGVIHISIGQKCLRFVAENHPDFWDGESDVDTPNINITNESIFVQEVVRAINNESEDGSTLLTRMLDRAIANAVESGCEGIDW